jgi:hypothetical protein
MFGFVSLMKLKADSMSHLCELIGVDFIGKKKIKVEATEI